MPQVSYQCVLNRQRCSHNLDASVFSNFWPISKLPFISNTAQKAVLIHLQSFLKGHGIIELFQSGFKRLYITESALLSVFNNLCLATDTEGYAILVHLHLTAAFDTVDHDIIISRWEQCVDISSTALKFFWSYLYDESFSVSLGELQLSSVLLSCGVPPGSILGPILFSFYLNLPAPEIQWTWLSSCQSVWRTLKAWMALNRLHFNNGRTEVTIWTQWGLRIWVPLSAMLRALFPIWG